MFDRWNVPGPNRVSNLRAASFKSDGLRAFHRRHTDGGAAASPSDIAALRKMGIAVASGNRLDTYEACGITPGITPGMTSTQLVSVKVPTRVLRRIPPAGQGRSRFIVAALEEKIARQSYEEWKPVTERGRRLAVLLEKGRKERLPLLDAEGIATELTLRKGGLH